MRAAGVSDSAEARAKSKRTADGPPVHSMQTLLADLARRPRSPDLGEAELPAVPERLAATVSRPTKLQERTFGLLGLDLSKTFAMQFIGWRGEIRPTRPADAGFFFVSLA